MVAVPFSANPVRDLSLNGANTRFTNESIIEKTYCPENLPQPLFAKEGKFLPFAAGQRGPLARRVKGGKEGFSLQCPYNYGPISNAPCELSHYKVEDFLTGFTSNNLPASCQRKSDSKVQN